MISLADLGSMESRVNASLARFRAELKFSKHFIYLRLNDPRNAPPLGVGRVGRRLASIHCPTHWRRVGIARPRDFQYPVPANCN
jgi:hypothetical protein